jgi:hypothetical protein
MMEREKPQCVLGLSSETLSSWHDRLLPEKDSQRIELHIEDCAACQYRLTQFEKIATALQRQHEPDLRLQTWRGLQLRFSQKERRFMHFPPINTTFRNIGAVAVLVLFAIFAVVVFSQRPGGGPGTTSTPTIIPTNTPVGTATTTIADCSSILPGSGPASAGSNFSDLSLPANSVSTALTKVGGGGTGQFTIYELKLCAPGSSVSAIESFFMQLTSRSWLHSNTFPADGAYQSDCPDAYCWAKDVRYVRLVRPISDLGGGIESYQLTLAVAPPAPNCDAWINSFPQGYYYKIPDPHYKATNVFANIPLPPLSRIIQDDASGGQRGYDVCSAGTIVSITSFMETNLTKLGWTKGNNGIWTKDGFQLTIRMDASTHWLIGWHNPDFG